MASQTDLGPTPFIYMDTTTKTMLTLLRASLNSQEPSLPLIDTDEWERLFWLARKHGVVTMVNDAIELLPPELQPQGDIALSWTLSAERTRYHFNHQQQVLQLIDQKANAEGLSYILLKGISLARLYPHPDSRPCGDIDICFPNNYDRGNILLGCPEAKIEGKHSETEIDGVTIENHLQLLDLHYRSQRRAERFIWNEIEHSSNGHFLSPMGNMVYLLMHTVSHLTAKYKLPLRNILDWGMFLRANRDTLNPKECHRVMQRIGMDEAFEILTKISSEFIGTDLSMFIQSPLRQDDVERMRELILTKKYLDPVPHGLPLPKYILARMRRNRQRRWIYRYLPSTRPERICNIIIRIFKKD